MPHDYFAPGLPVLSDEERRRRNAMQDEWRGLRQTGTTSRDIPSLNALQELVEPSYDELMQGARQTLQDTAPLQGKLNLAEQDALGTRPATTEQFAPRPTTTYKDVAEQTLGAGSFLPGPVGVASRAGTGLMGAYDLATEGVTGENLLQTSAPIFDIMGGLRAAANMDPLVDAGAGAFRVPAESVARSEAMAGARAGTRGSMKLGPRSEQGYRYNGELPGGKPIRGGAEVQNARVNPQTGEVVVPGDPWIGSMRTQVRDVPMEGPAESAFRSAGTARIPASMSDDVAEQVGRGIEGEGLQFSRPTPPNLEIQGNLLTPGPKGPGSPSRPSGPVFNPLDDAPSMQGLRGAADDTVDLTGALDDLGEAALSPEDIARARAAERFGQNFQLEGGMPASSVPSVVSGGLEGAIPADRLSALEALAAADEPSLRSVLFGGASGRSEGTFGKFVRPSERSPIGGKAKKAGRKR